MSAVCTASLPVMVLSGSYIVTDFSKEGTYLSDGTRLSYGNPAIVPANTIIYIGDIENAFKVR